MANFCRRFRTNGSIKDRARPMPRLGALVMRGLPAIPEDMIDVHRSRSAARLAQFTGDQFDRMKCAGANLDFLGRTRSNQLFAIDTCGQILVVEQDAVDTKDMRNEIVSEDCQLVEIAELAPTAVVERKREFGCRELSALVKGTRRQRQVSTSSKNGIPRRIPTSDSADSSALSTSPA